MVVGHPEVLITRTVDRLVSDYNYLLDLGIPYELLTRVNTDDGNMIVNRCRDFGLDSGPYIEMYSDGVAKSVFEHIN